MRISPECGLKVREIEPESAFDQTTHQRAQLQAPNDAPQRHDLTGFGLIVWRWNNRKSTVQAATRDGDAC